MAKVKKSKINRFKSAFEFGVYFIHLRKGILNLAKFLCGVDNNNKVNRSNLWSMLSAFSAIILLFIAYYQLQNINETTAADFSHKIKNDLYTPKKIRLMTLFDNGVLQFKSDSNENIWFELDTVQYKEIPSIDFSENIPIKYYVFEIDELLQDFEDLSFYEKKGQVKIDYIYNQYAYFIEMLWENPEIAKYIKWQRDEPHFSYSYRYLENLYKRLKSISDNQP